MCCTSSSWFWWKYLEYFKECPAPCSEVVLITNFPCQLTNEFGFARICWINQVMIDLPGIFSFCIREITQHRDTVRMHFRVWTTNVTILTSDVRLHSKCHVFLKIVISWKAGGCDFYHHWLHSPEACMIKGFDVDNLELLLDIRWGHRRSSRFTWTH